MKRLCRVCKAHPGWATADESRRRDPQDTCRACLGSGIEQVTETVSVTSTTGVRFNVVVLETGDHYGLDDCLTVGEGNSLRLEGEGPFVEFYDARFAFTPQGQFVSRYGVSTILGTDGYGTGTGGLNLDAGIPDWKIDAAAMDVVRAWLRHEIGAR